jgi:predicted dehydrogenase
MADELKVGLVGLDTSHVVAFCGLMNDPSNAHYIPGAKVVVGWPGGSEDFDLSIDRVEGFTDQLRDEYGVEIVETPEQVAEKCDLIALTACDGRVHLELYEKIVSAGKPIFIDKPFATTTSDAERIVELAAGKGVATMSCSSLRYADNFQAALKALNDTGGVYAIDVCGPMQVQPPIPGVMWYGCHTAEMIVAAMGPGIDCVQAVKTDEQDVITYRWKDGRLATMRGLRGEAHKGFGLTLHGKESMQFVDCKANDRPYYASLWEAILRSLPHGKSDIPAEEMVEVVRMMEAANESRDASKPVCL